MEFDLSEISKSIYDEPVLSTVSSSVYSID